MPGSGKESAGVAGAGAGAAGAGHADGSASEHLESVVAAFVEKVALIRPQRGARRYYGALLEQLQGVPGKPPSMSAFVRRFGAERARRKGAVLQHCRLAAARVSDAAGEGGLEVAPGEPPVGRVSVEQAAVALGMIRSSCVRHAYWDYLDVARGARSALISEATFRALVLSPQFVAAMPGDAMPDWWRRKAR